MKLVQISIGNSRHLPFYQIKGGTELEREAFGQILLAALVRRSLCGVYLNRERCQNSHWHTLYSLARIHDLVLIDEAVELPVELLSAATRKLSEQDCLFWSGGEDPAMEDFIDCLIEKMDALARQVPVWGCVLIGGKSSRMGRPKHLIEDTKHTTWLERTTDILRPMVDGMVVSGAGILPDRLAGMVRLPDIPGVAGPLTGVLAATRWQPTVSWLLLACDMPFISPEAIRWLLSGRRAGCWGRVPRLAGREHCEPLLAWYDFRASHLFEAQLACGNLRIGQAGLHHKVDNPLVPGPLCNGWENINTPDELPAHRSK